MSAKTVLASLKPADQITATVYREVVMLLCEGPARIEFNTQPLIINIFGLQGVVRRRPR